MANVRFIKTTKEKHINRDTYDPNALYFCEDTQEIYKGQHPYTEGVKVIPTKADLPSCPCAADGVVYFIAETKSGYMMSPDRTEWLQTIYAPVTDAYAIPESEMYSTVTTVGAVRDIEKAIYEHIDSEIANVDGIESINFAGVEMTEVDGVFNIDQESARQALGISVPESVDGETVIIATEASVIEMSEELKAYIDEQIATGGTGTIDYGEI